MDDNTSKVYLEPDGSQPPLVAPNAGSGAQLFVINLCASIAPVSTTGRNIPGLENYKLYQVARVEDGRTRHRLRLGFFTNEAHAERVLTVVRQQYPTAFTTSLGDEDRRFARGYLPERSAPAPRPAVAVVNTAPPAPAAAPPVAKAVAAAPAASAAPRTAAPAAAKPAQPAVDQPAVAPSAVAPPAAAKPATPAAAKAPAASKAAQAAKGAAKAPSDEVVEMTWEPDEATKAAVTSASLPKIKALTEAVGLDEMSWDDEPAPAPGREPLAVGLLSGKFAKLDSSKIKNSKAATPEPPASKAAATTKPATPPAPVAVPPKLDSATSVRVPALTFSDPEPTPSAQKTNTAPNEPYHVGKGVRIEDVEDFELDLYDDAPAQPAAAVSQPAAAKNGIAAKNGAAAKQAGKPAAPVARKAEPPAKPAMPAAAKPVAPTLKQVPPAPVRDSSHLHPNLDSTQTIRALTNDELSDAVQDKWFAIQLAASEQPVNLDTMPHLDIFEAYRLYSVATAGSGKIVHSLRLGFFKEAVSAEAVAGYLKTFFASPSVLRISVAEQARFKDAPQPRRAEPEEPKNNVVELSNARASRAPVVPTVTMEVDPSATGAFRPNATGAFRANATGALNSATGTFKPGATGAFKPNATGAFKANATGAFKLNSTGVHKSLDTRAAAKSAAPATKRSDPTGKHKSLKKSLAEELLEEAREVELSESGVRKLPQNNSLLSRLLGKKK